MYRSQFLIFIYLLGQSKSRFLSLYPPPQINLILQSHLWRALLSPLFFVLYLVNFSSVNPYQISNLPHMSSPLYFNSTSFLPFFLPYSSYISLFVFSYFLAHSPAPLFLLHISLYFPPLELHLYIPSRLLSNKFQVIPLGIFLISVTWSKLSFILIS